jgi:hypothetical protein
MALSCALADARVPCEHDVRAAVGLSDDEEFLQDISIKMDDPPRHA